LAAFPIRFEISPFPTYIGIDPSKRMYTPNLCLLLFKAFAMFVSFRAHIVPYRVTICIASFFFRFGIG